MVTCPVHGWAGRTPGRLALRFEGRAWSWAELDADVAAWAGRLFRLGVRPGDRVALLSRNRPECLALLFAVRRLRATLVALNARLTAAELTPLVQRARPRVFLAEEALADRGSGTQCLERLGAARVAPFEGTAAMVPEEDWAILFTSGTTGAAKAVRLPVRSFVASAAASGANLGSAQDHRWLCNLPLFHVGALAMAVRTALAGAALVLQPRFEAAATARALTEEGISHASLVARTLEQTLAFVRTRPARLEAVLLGGGPSPESLVARAREARWPILLTYGLTEACSQVTTERPADADGATAGPPLPGLEVEIRGADGSRRGPGEEGCIAVRGPTLMAGYLDDEAATAAARQDGWLLTGDIGALDAKGRLRVLARRTDLILSGGENVYPAEVESVLAGHPDLSEVAVLGVDDARWGQVPVAFVVCRSGVLDTALVAWGRARLAGYKVPAHWIRREALPRTAAGKVDRAALQRGLAELEVQGGLLPVRSPGPNGEDNFAFKFTSS